MAGTSYRDINESGITDTWDRAFFRGLQDGALASHFRRSQRDHPDLLEAIQTVARTYNSIQAYVQAKSPFWAKSGRAKGLRKALGTKLASRAVLDAQMDRALRRDAAARAVDRGKQEYIPKTPEGSRAKETTRQARPATRTGESWRANPGISGRPLSSRGGSFGGEANYYAMVLGETIAEHGRAVQRAVRRRNILGVGRRGAASTRVQLPSGAGRTNRTGAASTRRGAQLPNSAPAPVHPGQSAQGVPRGRDVASPSTSADQRARTIMKSAPKLPTASKTAPLRNLWTDLLKNSLVNSLTTALTRPAASRGASTTKVGTRTSALPSSVSSALSARTTQPFLAMQTQSARNTTRDDCDCKKPTKEKDPSERKCTNPVVSKTIANGFITTKRKIQCQQSKQRFL